MSRHIHFQLFFFLFFFCQLLHSSIFYYLKKHLIVSNTLKPLLSEILPLNFQFSDHGITPLNFLFNFSNCYKCCVNNHKSVRLIVNITPGAVTETNKRPLSIRPLPVCRFWLVSLFIITPEVMDRSFLSQTFYVKRA